MKFIYVFPLCFVCDFGPNLAPRGHFLLIIVFSSVLWCLRFFAEFSAFATDFSLRMLARAIEGQIEPFGKLKP